MCWGKSELCPKYASREEKMKTTEEWEEMMAKWYCENEVEWHFYRTAEMMVDDAIFELSWQLRKSVMELNNGGK